MFYLFILKKIQKKLVKTQKKNQLNSIDMS